MSTIETQPSPEFFWPAANDSKWERERAAFLKLLPSLLTTQRGKYVAVYEGQVVDSGDDEIALALRAYDQIGYVPIFVGLVTDDPRPVMRMPSPRLYRRPASS